jgi:hypothetical protein
MKLEQQVCSLELAQKLKKLGVKQESLYYWSDHTIPATLWNEGAINKMADDFSLLDSAFTVAELGLLLPYGSKSFVGSTSGEKCNWTTEWHGANKDWAEGNMKFADTEADARAKMLCYLLENKLIPATV